MKVDESILEIPLDRLEEICQMQPQRMFKWGSELAKQKRDTKALKNKLKLIAAELNTKMTADPDSFGLTKTTEKAIEAGVLTHPNYQNALDELSQAEYEEDILDAFVKSLYDVSGETGKLAQLHGQMYWSKPNTSPKKTEQERTSAMDKVNQGAKRK